VVLNAQLHIQNPTSSLNLFVALIVLQRDIIARLLAGISTLTPRGFLLLNILVELAGCILLGELVLSVYCPV
jgi:hypothetical protein